MKNSGTIILLEASIESLQKRLQEDRTRPLLLSTNKAKDLMELFASRKERYESASDYRIRTDESQPSEIAMEIASILNRRVSKS